MKRRLVLMFGVLFLLMAPASAQQVIKLTMAEQNPEIAWGPTHAVKPWVKRLEEATRGRVKVDVFWAQSLAKGPDIWNAVKNGVADMGWCFHGFWPEMTPLSDVIGLPSLPLTTAEKTSEVLWKLYEKFPTIQNEYQDVHVIHFFTSTPYLLVTKKQVKTLDDIKGMKIRAVGALASQQMKALGAVPTPIPMPETYLSLDKGVIDGLQAPWEAVQAFRFFEIARYYARVPFPVAYFSISMNKQKWDSLPKDVQQAITGLGGLEAARFWGRNWFDTAEAAVDQAANKGGYQLIKYTPPPAEIERWRKSSGEPLWREWVKKMESRGHPEANKILETMLEMLKN